MGRNRESFSPNNLCSEFGPQDNGPYEPDESGIDHIRRSEFSCVSCSQEQHFHGTNSAITSLVCSSKLIRVTNC